MSVSSKFPSRSWFPNINLCLYCVTFNSRNNQCVTHKDNTICSISLPVLYSCFVFPQTVTSHRAWSSITVSAGIQTLCPPSPPRRLFFYFHLFLLSLVSLLSCQFVVRGQRLWARCMLGQLPQDLHADDTNCRCGLLVPAKLQMLVNTYSLLN